MLYKFLDWLADLLGIKIKEIKYLSGVKKCSKH